MLDISPLIEKMRANFQGIEQQLSIPDVISDRERFAQLSKEHQRLSKLLNSWDRMTDCKQEVIDNKEMLQTEDDPEFCDVIKSDIKALEEETETLEKIVYSLVLPPGDHDSRNTIIEIRPAAGGDEAALFADDLYRMYSKYAESRGWKNELLDMTSSDIGGLKAVSFLLKGEDVYRDLQYEGGVHRVQRVPTTETQGRIHTSTVTVAVMPEATEVDIQINENDLDIQYTRSSGSGGQHVNTTDSCCQITHIPTGLQVKCQQERSAHKNKEIALQMIRTQLLDEERRKEEAKYSAERSSQVGTGDRSERIRTYNFPQSRVTDHRFGLSWFSLQDYMNGDIQQIFDDIHSYQGEKRLEFELNNV